MHRLNLRLLLLLLLAIPATAFAQLKQYGPGRKAAEKIEVNKNARRHALNPVSLPFWDDFSSAKNHRADSLLWIVNDKVFINDGQAINPPSLNVATFDGYNENGLPYSTDPMATGRGDTLESQPIKLADFPVQYWSEIYLSFSYQPGGNSEMPNPDDYLLLEFKSLNMGWVEVKRLRVDNTTEHDKFYDVVIPIAPQVDANDTNFFHNDFRLRFRSLGRISGQYDSWHLDYVYLNRRVQDDEETPPPGLPTANVNEYDINTNISDRTTTKPFTTILPKGYYAMPVNHFNPAEMIAPDVSMYSLKHVNFLQVVNYEATYTITNYTEGVATETYSDSPDGGETSFNPPGFGIPVLQHATAQTKAIPNSSSYFDATADSTKIKVDITIDGGDNNSALDFYARYGSINFRSNDKLEHTFTLSNYYAYDDGVAEYSAGLAAQGNQLAYRFIMDESLGSRSLNGISIYLPYTGNTAPENMRIYIFRDDAGKPDSMFVYSQFVPVIRTANNVFTHIAFTQEVIVRDTFYIGYMETVTDKPDRIRVGLDASHDTGEHMYYRNTVYNQWIQNDEVYGSLMIRPEFGTREFVTGIEDPVKPVSIYPNPSRGEFYMKGPLNMLQVITVTGQAVSYSVEDQQDVKKITLHTTTPGIYIVRYRSGSKLFTEKILIKDY